MPKTIPKTVRELFPDETDLEDADNNFCTLVWFRPNDTYLTLGWSTFLQAPIGHIEDESDSEAHDPPWAWFSGSEKTKIIKNNKAGPNGETLTITEIKKLYG